MLNVEKTMRGTNNKGDLILISQLEERKGPDLIYLFASGRKKKAALMHHPEAWVQ